MLHGVESDLILWETGSRALRSLCSFIFLPYSHQMAADFRSREHMELSVVLKVHFPDASLYQKSYSVNYYNKSNNHQMLVIFKTVLLSLY